MAFIIKNKKLFAFAFWLWISVIVYFSLTPISPGMKVGINNQAFRLDYILHFMVYFSLAVIFLFWKADKYFKVKPILLIYFLIGGFILSGLTEYVQTFVPGRTFNPNDFYSNAAGILLGVLTPRVVLR